MPDVNYADSGVLIFRLFAFVPKHAREPMLHDILLSHVGINVVPLF